LITGRKDNPGIQGFTLLELILVMVMISLVLAMAAPSLRGFTAGRRTADTASQILAMTKLARTQAMSEGRIYRLNIDEDEHSYWLTRQEGGAFVEIESSHGQIFFLPDRVTFEMQTPEEGFDTENTYIQFYPDGRSDEASIVITGQMGETVHVLCRSATERFRIMSNREVESSGL